MNRRDKILKLLNSRFARNIYFWVLMVWSFLSLNNNNAKALGFNFNSPWYYYIHIVTLCLYLIVIYTSNLILVPRYWVRKKWLKYFLFLLPLCFFAAVIQSCVIRLGLPHFDVNDMQQIGGASMNVEKEWTFFNVINDAISFALYGYLMWSFLFIMAWYMRDYNRQKGLAEEATRKQVETELHFLKNQLNPHFLFNTMNNLYGLALKKSDETPETILKLSSIMRYLLYESNAPMVSFEKEKEIMQAYIDLELLRIKDISKLNFTITADHNYSLPPLLWMPVLENLFKHGTRHIAENYEADFMFSISDNKLLISSCNTYKPVSNGQPGGIGLTNLSKRLELLYRGKYKISEDKTDNSYTISIEIALV